MSIYDRFLMLDMIDRDFVEHLFHFHNIFDKNMTIYNRSTGKIYEKVETENFIDE